MNLARWMVLSFALAIATGTCLLLLPGMQPPGATPVSPLDALFTITSAVCVTGLTVRDTGTTFTLAGQGVILLMIQMGGLGILTFSTWFITARAKRVGVADRMLLETSHGHLPRVAPMVLIRAILLYTFVIEGVGALLLTLRFLTDHPPATALWLGVFHAVSAFCNAGFGLFVDNLMGYRDDVTVNGVIMALIILGGLGFVVLADLAQGHDHRRRQLPFRLTLHSRMVLRTSAWLVAGGTVVIALLEWAGGWDSWAVPHTSLFLAVTARTAGFNTVDMAQLSNATLMVVILLMAIGGSPGSTAGGFKTTSAATFLAILISRARNRPGVEYLDRSLPEEVVTRTLLTITAFFLVAFAGFLTLQFTEAIEQGMIAARGKSLDYLFETVSALATVGLSLGVTAALSPAGKVVIIVMMFIGRLGPLLVAESLVVQQPRLRYSLPPERVNIG